MTILPIGVGVPYLCIRYIFKEKLTDYGFRLGEARDGAVWLLALVPVYIFLPMGSAYIGTEGYYTYLLKPAFLKPTNIAIHSVSYAAFTFGFEFLFRGFVLFGLSKGMGNTDTSKWIAAGVSGALSALALIGLPWVFPVSALLSALPGAWLNFRLRSFLFFAFIHWNIGIWSDIWEIIKLNVSGGVL